jgi:hypothetical protein
LYLDPSRGENHLLRDGKELPATFPWAWDLSGYPDAAHYQLTQHVRGGLRPYPTEVLSTWDFTSQRPTGNDTVPGFACLGQLDPQPNDPCRVERVLFLGYDFGSVVSLDNTARAGVPARLKVNVYQQTGAPASRILGLRTEISYDRGGHWQLASTRALGGGEFSVDVGCSDRQANATVSLRTEAWDNAGNRVRQTLLDAYRLSGR